MTDDKLKSIEAYARTLPNPIFALDVEQLVEEMRRLQAAVDLARGALADIAHMTSDEIAAGVAQRKARRIYDETSGDRTATDPPKE